MAKIHGQNTDVLVDDADLTTYFNSASVALAADAVDSTCFGSADRTFVRGPHGGTISLGGYFDGTTDAVDDVLAGLITNATGKAVTVGFDGTAAGKRVNIAGVLESSYESGAPVDGLATVAAEFQGGPGPLVGVSLKALDTNTGNSATHDNAASSANGGIATLHITQNSRNGTATVTLRHSTDNFSASDVLLASFTVVTAATTASECITFTGTVNRYVRSVVTLAGSTGTVTSQISIARK